MSYPKATESHGVGRVICWSLDEHPIQGTKHGPLACGIPGARRQLHSAGQILYCGEPMDRDLIGYRQRFGYVPEEPHLYPHLTGTEYLEMVRLFRGIACERLEPNPPAGVLTHAPE